MSVYAFSHPSIEGVATSLDAYKGKVLLLVNVASRCGFTKHYTGLQALYESHEDLVVLGFPCNQFGAQEPGTDAEIKEFCESKYNVTFPMFSKVDVKGPNQHPLFAHITQVETTPEGAGDISWNFAKFLVGRDGKVVARFGPNTAPHDGGLLSSISTALAAK